VVAAEFVEESGRERLERPSDSVLARKGDSQPGGQQREEECGVVGHVFSSCGKDWKQRRRD
jgi:hypothetical protein